MPEPVDLSYAVTLPPEEAIAYFEAKGYAFSWDWADVWQEAHSKAFTVAKVAELELLQDIRKITQQAIDQGLTYNQFQKLLEPMLKAKGWWGKQQVTAPDGTEQTVQLGSPWRLKTIYETNLQVAYSAGHYREQIENVDSRPWWQYVGILDARIRPAHRAMHGLVARYDDPFWTKFYPPNGWNCRCTVRALTGEQRTERLAAKTGFEPEKGKLFDVGGVSHFGFTDAVGHEVVVKTDLGWSYNPGAVEWQPDLAKLDPDIAGLF